MEYNSANPGGDNKGKPKLTDGFVEIDWNILEDGKVKKAEMVSSDLNAESLNQCILKVISAIEFPPPPTGMQTYTTYKYNFKKVKL
ncbi:MAG TPA: AgmX/PglI C-terminal domain-containing protein [Leptospiraceae bacterium]|nr:AgmX/PglI C-terminal domain-containing protein [Leptospiraceae bacterium]